MRPEPPMGAWRALAPAVAKANRQRKWRAFALTLPLLVFLLVTLLVPIGTCCIRAVENPEVANALPRTVASLGRWSRQRSAARTAAYAARGAPTWPHLSEGAAGALARRLNSEQRRRPLAGDEHLPRPASLHREGSDASGRSRAPADAGASTPAGATLPYWQAIAKNGDALDARLPAGRGGPAPRPGRPES